MEKIVLAQILGVIGFILSVLLYQFDKRAQILYMRIAASAVFSVHFLMLGAWTGSMMQLLACVRTYVFKKRTEESWADNKIWLYLFLSLVVVFTFVSWEGYRSILPFIGLTFGTLAYWSKTPHRIRMFGLVTPPAWFAYDFIVGSYPGMAVEVFLFTSLVIGIIRFDILKKKDTMKISPIIAAYERTDDLVMRR